MNTPHILYELVEEVYHCNNCNDICRISYGIAAYIHSEEEEFASIIASAHDISSDREKVLDLVSRCNRMELSPAHLADVIEDFLS